MPRRKRRRRLHHDEPEISHQRLMPPPDYAHPRDADTAHVGDTGSSNRVDMILGLQRTRGNQFVRQLVKEMQGRQSQSTHQAGLQQALTPAIQRMAPTSRLDTQTTKLSPQAAIIMQEWAKEYQHWFVSQVIEMIAEQFHKYVEQNKDHTETQTEAGDISSQEIDFGKQLENAGGPPNNIFESLYLMQKGMPISPEYVPVEEWEVPDDVESIADLFGKDVAEFVSRENSRFSEAQSTDPHADMKSISTAQHLVNLLAANERSWFPTVADPGSPPQ